MLAEPRFRQLADWLNWQESLHPKAIDLGLERCEQVYRGLVDTAPDFKLITVAGTNGKGSSVAMLEALYLQAGYQVGCYTSPHLQAYNERVRLNGVAVDDQSLCAAFAAIDAQRGDTGLTYFEFGTLAAMLIFRSQPLDVVIMEVGLGGRLDAVNLFDPDVALITRIAIDHTDWLGEDRETIGYEKAGVLRTGKPAVCGDPQPPASVLAVAEQRQVPLLLAGRDFDWRETAHTWSWHGPGQPLLNLAPPGIQGRHQYDNASAVLAVVHLLRETLPIASSVLQEGLAKVSLPGRLQCIAGRPAVLLDVSHNPDGTGQLANFLREHPITGRNIAVVSMLADKQHRQALSLLTDQVDTWLLADSGAARGCKAATLEQAVADRVPANRRSRYASVSAAWEQARQVAGRSDRIVVFGSFVTVAEVMRQRDEVGCPGKPAPSGPVPVA